MLSPRYRPRHGLRHRPRHGKWQGGVLYFYLYCTGSTRPAVAELSPRHGRASAQWWRLHFCFCFVLLERERKLCVRASAWNLISSSAEHSVLSRKTCGSRKVQCRLSEQREIHSSACAPSLRQPYHTEGTYCTVSMRPSPHYAPLSTSTEIDAKAHRQLRHCKASLARSAAQLSSTVVNSLVHFPV